MAIEVKFISSFELLWSGQNRGVFHFSFFKPWKWRILGVSSIFSLGKRWESSTNFLFFFHFFQSQQKKEVNGLSRLFTWPSNQKVKLMVSSRQFLYNLVFRNGWWPYFLKWDAWICAGLDCVWMCRNVQIVFIYYIKSDWFILKHLNFVLIY